MSYRAVIFDLDGTLLDTLQDLADSMNAVLEAEGLPSHPVEAYRYFVGDGMEMLARRVLGEAAVDGDLVRRCMRRMDEEYGRRWDRTTRPYPGIAEMLDELHTRRLPTAVFSNKPDEFTQVTVRSLLSAWTFAAVRGARADTPRKPDPAGALIIASALGLDPDQVAYVGDTNTDMQTARAAGMLPVGATWGFRSEAELAQSGAANLVRSPAEILPLLDDRGTQARE